MTMQPTPQNQLSTTDLLTLNDLKDMIAEGKRADVMQGLFALAAKYPQNVELQELIRANLPPEVAYGQPQPYYPPAPPPQYYQSAPPPQYYQPPQPYYGRPPKNVAFLKVLAVLFGLAAIVLFLVASRFSSPFPFYLGSFIAVIFALASLFSSASR